MFGRHLKESLKDLLITHFGSPNGVHNNDALCFTEGVGASADRSKRIRIPASVWRVAVPFGQRVKAHVLEPGSFWSGNPPTSLVYGSKGAVVVDGGALRDLAEHGTGLRCGPCRPRCTDSDTRTQPFTTPMLTPTEKSQTMSGWRERNAASVLVTMCGYVWRSGEFGENRSRSMSKGS